MNSRQRIAVLTPLPLIAVMIRVSPGFLAEQTGTLWWSMIAHAIGGLIMIA